MSHNQPSGLIINYWHLYYLLWSDLCTDCTPLSHSLTLGVGSITIIFSSRSGNRTHTAVSGNRILSPACLPVSPSGRLRLTPPELLPFVQPQLD